MKIGYCCINMSINQNKPKKEWVSVNRGMTKKTFEKLGLERASHLALLNLVDLKTILEWNVKNNITLYRMSSDMFPCIGFYKLEDLPNFDLLKNVLINIGNYSKENNIRLTFHPSHFCVLSSEKPEVLNNTIDELNKHAQIMDLMGLEQSHYYPINIHVGSTKPTHQEASQRFCNNFELLSDSCKARLVVENDDGPNQYSTKMIWDLIWQKIKIPITHDFHHHVYGQKDLSQEDALKLAISTWDTTALTHMSSSKTIEDKKALASAHADFIWEKIPDFGLNFDVELECKMKDIALLDYNKKFL